MKLLTAALAVATVATLTAPAVRAADGKAVFALRCGGCHGAAGAGTVTAPSLKGVVGRKPGTAAGFTYSPALKGKSGVWDDAALNAYLTNPAAAAPGTKMFGALPVAADRAAVIAFLKTLK